LVPEAAELAAPEGTVRAVDVVQSEPEHERLKRYLLADVFLCDTLATALALWARDPGARTFVSADGEVVDKEGIVSGGSLEGVAEVEREEAQSREAVSGGESEQQDREARLRALQADLLRAREKAESVQAEVTRTKVSAAAVAERREGVGRSLARLSEQRSEI